MLWAGGVEEGGGGGAGSDVCLYDASFEEFAFGEFGGVVFEGCADEVACSCPVRCVMIIFLAKCVVVVDFGPLQRFIFPDVGGNARKIVLVLCRTLQIQ